MALLITFLLGIFIIAGAMIAGKTKHSSEIAESSVSIAFGTMTALAILELIPDTAETLENQSIFVMLVCICTGFMILKILDIFIPDHHNTGRNIVHIGIMSSVAIIVHNIIEGMAVYSMYTEDMKTGLMVALGVGLHNVPMGAVIYSTLKSEKKIRKTGILLVMSVSAFAGGIIMKLMWLKIDDLIIGILMALTLGMISYIIICELLPHMMYDKKRGRSVIGAAAGAAVVLVSVLLE